MTNQIVIHNEDDLRSKIYTIRGLQVMLNFDLAEIYGYETKVFNRQVKNKIKRFDEDFRFQLTQEEPDTINLRCNFCTSSSDLRNQDSQNWGGKRYLPYAFTEQGIYHDRYIFVDYGTKTEKIFHCGGSSKDGGSRTMSISQVEDTKVYQNIAADLLKNPALVL